MISWWTIRYFCLVCWGDDCNFQKPVPKDSLTLWPPHHLFRSQRVQWPWLMCSEMQWQPQKIWSFSQCVVGLLGSHFTTLGPRTRPKSLFFFFFFAKKKLGFCSVWPFLFLFGHHLGVILTLFLWWLANSRYFNILRQSCYGKNIHQACKYGRLDISMYFLGIVIMDGSYLVCLNDCRAIPKRSKVVMHLRLTFLRMKVTFLGQAQSLFFRIQIAKRKSFERLCFPHLSRTGSI